jgi:hypothetical protein
MAQSVFPAPSAASKTRKVESLYSGTSWTVPANVTYVNATLIGGGGGGGTANDSNGSLSFTGSTGFGGQITQTTVATTPAASITYAIGAGGTGSGTGDGGNGGSTTFTGATTAVGGLGAKDPGGVTAGGRDGLVATNGAAFQASANRYTTGGNGGSGAIILEYWV